ncbi:hypothetical protein KRP22_012323 [Phytophthora ramorum]|nr:ABC transporter C family member 5 [Phytophthora ramorum]
MTALLQSAVSPVTRAKQPHYDTFTNGNDEPKQRLQDAAAPTPGTASFWSRLFFSYANPLMDTGNLRQLNLGDLWELEGENESAAAFDQFVQHYNRHSKSITKAMATAYGGEFLVWGLAMLFSTACGLLAPVVLHHVIDALSMAEIDLLDLSVWLGTFFASRFVNAVLSTQMNYSLELVALRLTVTLKSLLFQKAMRRSSQSKKDSTAVDISNLLTSDVNNVLWAAFQVNKLWIIPIQISVAVWMIYIVIDLAAFAGLAVIAVSMLASYFLAKFSGAAFVDLMQRKDERLSVIKEVFNAIQIVKLNAWEDKFAEKIHSFRTVELSAVQRFLYLGAVNITILWSSPLAVSAVSFAVYAIIMENELTAAKVFTAIALFNALRDPLRDLPTVIQMFIQAKISINRFSDYLSLDEFQPTNVTRDDSSQPEDVVMAIEDVSPRSAHGDDSHDGENQPAKDIDIGRLIDDEEREEGRVSKEVFSNYFESLGGMKVCIFLFVVQTLWQVCQIGSDLWLSHWTGQKDGSYNPDETAYNVKVYAWLGAGAATMVFVRSATVAIVGLRASRHLFDNMTLSLLKAPLRFFDANPIGRILNRYGDDMSAIDFMISFAFQECLGLLFFTVCQLTTAVYMINFLGALIIPLAWIYLRVGNHYLAPSRETARLWKISASPILSHVSQSEEGVIVVRAFAKPGSHKWYSNTGFSSGCNSSDVVS